MDKERFTKVNWRGFLYWLRDLPKYLWPKPIRPYPLTEAEQAQLKILMREEMEADWAEKLKVVNEFARGKYQISFKMTGESFYIKERGTVYTANLTCNCTRTHLSSLIGTPLLGRKILGVESFAIENQNYKPIGLLLEDIPWKLEKS